FHPRWTRWPVWVWSAWVIAWNIFPKSPISPLQFGTGGYIACFLPAYLSAHLLQTWRMNHYYNAQQKQQMKWILTGLTIALVFGFVVAFVPQLVIPALSGKPTAINVL